MRVKAHGALGASEADRGAQLERVEARAGRGAARAARCSSAANQTARAYLLDFDLQLNTGNAASVEM